MLAEARHTADSAERILILSRAMELAAKAEVLERQLRMITQCRCHQRHQQTKTRHKKSPAEAGLRFGGRADGRGHQNTGGAVGAGGGSPSPRWQRMPPMMKMRASASARAQ